MDGLGYMALSFGAAAVGSLGGLGGAILLVPVLVLTGLSPSLAAPLGLLCVASGSIAAAPRQLRERSVNHRLGVSVELLAASGAVVGALLSESLSQSMLTHGLAAVTALAAFAGIRRSGLRNRPDPACVPTDIGERVGALAGAYPLDRGIVPYRATRLPAGLAFMALAGFVAGTSGASGGFMKTPTLSELMHVPVRVAAATTTFTVGFTASTALIIFALQGRIDTALASPVIAGSLLGGVAGAILQSHLHPVIIRRGVCTVLFIIAGLLVARS